jgi:hypothetical protein
MEKTQLRKLSDLTRSKEPAIAGNFTTQRKLI